MVLDLLFIERLCIIQTIGGLTVSNQVLLWAALIIPWVSLLFIPKDAKRYISMGLLAFFLSLLVCEVGVANRWWRFLETTYPLAIFSSYVYGFFPTAPVWILKYTYGRFWLYALVDTVANLVFAYLVLPWFASRGIIDYNAGLIVFIFESVIAAVLYVFQMWQEGVK